jgi:two-component system OmpR family response regulator
MQSVDNHVLLVEDDPVLAHSVSSWLMRAGFSVLAVQTGDEGQQQLSQKHFDAVILDLGLPGIDGRELVRRIRANANTIPVLITTARDSLADKVGGLNDGADDYLTKPFELQELEARLRVLLRRKQSSETGSSTIGNLKINHMQGTLMYKGEYVDLAPVEFKVFQLLLKAEGNAVKKSEIAIEIATDAEVPNDNAVEVYIHRLRKRFEGTGVTIRTVRGIGYNLLAD